MKRIRQKTFLTALLMTGVLTLIGCQSQSGSRQYIVEDGETTVVIHNLDSVLPKEGAALEKKVVENFKGFDFLEDTALVGYRFSDTVFGDDRGVWTYELDSKGYGYDLNIEVIPKIGSLSKDKTKLVVIPDGPGTTEKILLKELGNSLVERYDIDKKAYLYTFNWQYSGEGLTSISNYGNEEQILRILPDGTLKKYKLSVPPLHFIDSANFQSDSQQMYYALAGGTENGIYKFSWESQKTEKIASDLFVVNMRLSPKGDKFAVVEGFQNTRDKSKLTVVGMNGKRLYTIFEAIAIERVQWQPDGMGLAFSALSPEGTANLYHADLVNGQLHFLGEYPGYSMEYMAFDSKSNKLMVSYLNRTLKTPKWTTHILTLKEEN